MWLRHTQVGDRAQPHGLLSHGRTVVLKFHKTSSVNTIPRTKWSLNEAGDGGQGVQVATAGVMSETGAVGCEVLLVVSDAPEVSGSVLFPGLYDEEKCHRCG